MQLLAPIISVLLHRVVRHTDPARRYGLGTQAETREALPQSKTKEENQLLKGVLRLPHRCPVIHMLPPKVIFKNTLPLNCIGSLAFPFILPSLENNGLERKRKSCPGPSSDELIPISFSPDASLRVNICVGPNVLAVRREGKLPVLSADKDFSSDPKDCPFVQGQSHNKNSDFSGSFLTHELYLWC